jgi:hypothetical protein
MPYTEHVTGTVGLNYRAEPVAGARLKEAAAPVDLTQASGQRDRPPAHSVAAATPLLEAIAGDLVKIRVILPWSEQVQVFSLENHRWPLEPRRRGSNLLSSTQVGGMEALTLTLSEGAGGPDRVPGDYLYGDHREAYREAGLWGIFRVYHPDEAAPMRPLR